MGVDPSVRQIAPQIARISPGSGRRSDHHKNAPICKLLDEWGLLVSPEIIPQEVSDYFVCPESPGSKPFPLTTSLGLSLFAQPFILLIPLLQLFVGGEPLHHVIRPSRYEPLEFNGSSVQIISGESQC